MSTPLKHVLATWAGHAAGAVGVNLVCLMMGVDPIGGAAMYLGHEIAQHRRDGTFGFWGWVDRIGDAGIPFLLSFAMFKLLV